MTYPKLFAIIATISFATVAFLAIFKTNYSSQQRPLTPFAYTAPPIAISLATELRPKSEKASSFSCVTVPADPPSRKIVQREAAKTSSSPTSIALSTAVAVPQKKEPSPPEANRIEELFNKGEPKLPIVETIVYKSNVPWHKGRPAWLADYANYYGTSRHFIARSLNGKPDYLRQEVCNGDRFNVFRKDKEISFYLLVDIGRLKMWFYAIDHKSNERTLLKTYRVGLGRLDPTKQSGYLTPVGTYLLGNKVAIYQPKIEGHYKGKKVEMIRVFGSRWIPFDKELDGCSEPAKGLGLHGVPWALDVDAILREDRSSLEKYESDGCIRLADADIKELFAIIVTKPTTINLVKDFYNASLPGTEK